MKQSSGKKNQLTSDTRRLVAYRYGIRRPGDRVEIQCRYCGTAGVVSRNQRWVSCTNLAFDHIVPESRGGSSRPDNLQLICKSCNASKADRTHEEYLEARLRMPSHVRDYLIERGGQWLE